MNGIPFDTVILRLAGLAVGFASMHLGSQLFADRRASKAQRWGAGVVVILFGAGIVICSLFGWPVDLAGLH